MSRALILGSVGRKRLIDLSPIGVVNGREIFPLKGAEDDPAGDGGGLESEDDEQEDEEDEEDGHQDDEEDDAKGRKKKPAARKDANAAFAAMQREIRQLKREKAAREKEDRQKELAGKSEVEKVTAERDDATKELESLREQHRNAVIQLEIFLASRKKYDWADMEDVLNDKRLRAAIEIDDDGEVTGVAEALKDLAKRKPHFLAAKSDEDEKGQGPGGTGKKPAAGKTGGQPGSGGGSGDREADRQALMSKYSALGPLVPNQ